MGETDNLAMEELQEEINAYILQRILSSETESHPFINIFPLTWATHTQKSCVEYLDLLDAVADRKDTMMKVLQDLHQQLIIDQKQQWVIVEGDALYLAIPDV